MEGHNTWCVNVPGSLLVIPVADLAQHMIAILCFFAQNGYCDLRRRQRPARSRARAVQRAGRRRRAVPLTFAEQYALTEATAELATAATPACSCCRRWASAAGCSTGSTASRCWAPRAIRRARASGFRYDKDERWPTRTPPVARASSRRTARRTTRTWPRRSRRSRSASSAPGGPFNRDTPGAWSDSPGVRGSAQVHDEEFKACVALQAQYVFDTFGKFPGTVPTLFILNYVQAHHLDLTSTTASSSRAPTSAPTPSTWSAGTVTARRAEGWAKKYARATSTSTSSRSGHGPDVLLLGGLSDPAEAWQPQLDGLAGPLPADRLRQPRRRSHAAAGRSRSRCR